VQALRRNDIAAELYHENTKMDKQFKYAEKKAIPYVVIIGSREMENAQAVVKDLQKGEQHTVDINEIISFFRNI
jgi:histidyl-tRNA synthetase